jgi:hypothetical protein
VAHLSEEGNDEMGGVCACPDTDAVEASCKRPSSEGACLAAAATSSMSPASWGACPTAPCKHPMPEEACLVPALLTPKKPHQDPRLRDAQQAGRGHLQCGVRGGGLGQAAPGKAQASGELEVRVMQKRKRPSSSVARHRGTIRKAVVEPVRRRGVAVHEAKVGKLAREMGYLIYISSQSNKRLSNLQDL